MGEDLGRGFFFFLGGWIFNLGFKSYVAKRLRNGEGMGESNKTIFF